MAGQQRDDDSDSMYSDDVQFQYLDLGTIEEQAAAREACDDGDNDSDVFDSAVSSVESVFDAPLERQPSESNLGITRQWRTGFVLGGDIEPSTVADPNGDGNGNPDPDPESGLEANPDSLSNPASSPEQVDSQTEGPPDHPAFPVLWARAPRDYEIEEMPGFLHFDIQNGRRVAIFDERTWKEGFTRGLRKHIMKRARRDDDCDE